MNISYDRKVEEFRAQGREVTSLQVALTNKKNEIAAFEKRSGGQNEPLLFEPLENGSLKKLLIYNLNKELKELKKQFDICYASKHDDASRLLNEFKLQLRDSKKEFKRLELLDAQAVEEVKIGRDRFNKITKQLCVCRNLCSKMDIFLQNSSTLSIPSY